MVVVVIIGVLVALISPAIFAVVRRAREAEVRTEISQLDTAIAAFQTEFGGIAPPSRITFPDLSSLNLTNSADRLIAQNRWNALPRSKAIIRRLWPQFNFGINGGNANLKESLNGAECLVFFLGGLRDGADGPLVGFSKNPARPFQTGGSRVGPFFDFKLGRLTKPDASGNPKAPEYLDPLPGQITPYIYLSGYDGRGYRAKEFTDFDTDSSKPTWWTLTSWYTQSSGTVAHKPNSHQIISPGSDNKYGTGGVYDGKNYKSPSIDDGDNITNFSSGRLTP
jgi:type II secretory pathway pseudopilin PulG